MAKKDIWDILFWIGMLVLIAYIIAKLFGIINTPEWLNLLPLITLAFVIGAFYQKVAGFMERILNRTDYLKNNIDMIANKLNEHDKKIFALEKNKELISK